MRKKSGADGGDYEVGYGKPPRAHRFKKGQSGNPKGRRKRNLNRKTILLAALEESVTVQIGGKKKTMSKGELAFRRFIQRAIESGESKYMRLLDELMRDYGIGNDPVPVEQTKKNPSVVFFIPHNGRGPVGQPILKEKPGRPVSEWEVDTDTYDPVTGLPKEK
ncbi:MAG: hypothetical protein HYU58_08935 [Proteobacteria bacterium]|nr:hypothetical protein [Pseudomonadota bacterium]